MGHHLNTLNLYNQAGLTCRAARRVGWLLKYGCILKKGGSWDIAEGTKRSGTITFYCYKAKKKKLQLRPTLCYEQNIWPNKGFNWWRNNGNRVQHHRIKLPQNTPLHMYITGNTCCQETKLESSSTCATPALNMWLSLNPICSLGFQIINSTLFIPSLALS